MPSLDREASSAAAAAATAAPAAAEAAPAVKAKASEGRARMIARFFIDRPIFATVLSVVITLIGGIALFALPVAQYPRITPPGVVIAISYPGASAQVVADTVAAPIEQQVSGVPGMLYMSSQSGNDGSYSLTVTFDVGTDLNTNLVMVQNRVTLAMPQLPSAVQNQGITIRKRTPDILMIVNFFSPDGRYDDIYLSNFATIYVRDELLRVYGVSDINYLGQRDYSIRAWLDPQKLASRNMTAMDVARAIREQNLDAPAGQIGQPPAARGQSSQFPIDTLGRLTEPEQFGDIIVKVDPATAADLSARSAMSTQGTLGGGGGGVSGQSTSSSMGSGSSQSDTQMQIDTTLVDSITQALSSGGVMQTGPTSVAAPTIGPTARIGATGGGRTTSTATSTASMTSAAPVSIGSIGGGNVPGAGTSGGGGTTGGGATTATVGTGSAAGPATNSQRVGSALTRGITSSAIDHGPPNPSDSVVRLRDVARVELGAQNYNQSCIFDGRPSVGLSVYQLPGNQCARCCRAGAGQDEGAEDPLSGRRGLRDRLRHNAVYPRVGRRRLYHSARSRGPGWTGGPGLLAGLAGDDPAHDRRAGFADRHPGRHGCPRFQPEQHLAVRPGAGDRHRG